ncbi:hypothetical protein EAF04_005396 [Stromatinia cepivora]|nr:hypothetical protein EAF04_005396 [Stromatinia cepivora]
MAILYAKVSRIRLMVVFLSTKLQRRLLYSELAKINLDLVSLLPHIDKGTPTKIVEMLVEPIDESKSQRTRLDDILSSTRDFLETLGLLAGSSRQPSANSSRSSRFPHLNSNLKSNTSGPSHQNHRSSYASSLSDTDDSNTSSPTNNPPSSTPTTLSSSGMQMCFKLEFASLLLILTSYINLLRLYVVLFSHIYDFLREILDSDDPSLCPLPGLSFCSFPLQSGNLQTTILIQIITSLFERIERLLGLPREFRINSRESAPDGLLSDDEFVDIVRLVFQTQESDQSDSRRGGVKALRGHLKEIKQY